MTQGAGVLAGNTVLDTSDDQRVLERVATMLAGSSQPEDRQLVIRYLTDVEFLHRLDSAYDPAFKTVRFRRVALALGENPDADDQLVELSQVPEVRDDVDRMLILLDATARVRPLSAARAQIFRGADPDTFLITCIGLLTANGSPQALDEVKREILHPPPQIDESIVGMMHKAFLRARLEPAVIRMAQDLVQALSSPALIVGTFESFFDYQYEEWFGPVKSPPEPPPWTNGSDEAVAELLRLADMARGTTLPARVTAAVSAAIAALRALQGQRAVRP